MISYSFDAGTHWEGTECIVFHGKWGYSFNHRRSASQRVGQRFQMLVSAQKEIRVAES
jgi:hypothetical protein